MKRIVHVLGLGTGIENYNPHHEVLTIGVNDIWKYHKTDVVLCIDKPHRFSPERLETIKNCLPAIFYTCWPEWVKIKPTAQLIEIDNKLPGRGGKLDNLDSDKIYPVHVDSTFTAVCLAYRFIKAFPFNGTGGIIIMYGCRFHGHKDLEQFIPGIKDCYRSLFFELQKRNVTLFNADPESVLNEILPIYE